MTLMARYSAWRLALYLVGSVALAAGGALMLDHSRAGSTNFVLGLAASLFFAWAAVVLCLRLFDKREILVLDHRGLFDRRVVDKTIPWNAVSGVRERRIYKQVYFTISLARPVREFSGSRYKRFLLAINRPFGGDLYVSARGLSVDTKRLRETLNTFIQGSAVKV